MSIRRVLRRSAAATVVTTLIATGSAAAAQAEPAKSTPAKSDSDLIQKQLDRYRTATGSIGASATVRDSDGLHSYSSGSAQLIPRTELNEDTRFRVGSQTKMFVATIVLQLVEKGRVDLDKPIEHYLPGVVRGKGLDPEKITVRHLLQHRSGIKDFAGGGVLLNPRWQMKPPTEQQLVDEGSKAGKQFEPGAEGRYSNTGYVLLGMLVKKVTGNDLTTEIDNRIVEPLGLGSTFYPQPGQKDLPKPYAHGYMSVSGLPIVDLTRYEPSVWGAAGALVSDGRDMTTFLNALLHGKLLSKAMLAEMRKTKPLEPAGQVGLGLAHFKDETDCKNVWGHAGLLAGYTTVTVSNGKRTLFAGINNTPTIADGKAQEDSMRKMINKALCK